MESYWRRISIATPTRCLRCVPRLTSCGQLRFISAIVLRASFLFGPGAFSCICYYQLRASCFSVPQSCSLQYKLRGSLEKEDSGLSFHRPPSPTPTQGLFKKYSHPSMLAARGRFCCSGLRAPAAGASDASSTAHGNKKIKRTLRDKIHTLALNSHLVSL